MSVPKNRESQSTIKTPPKMPGAIPIAGHMVPFGKNPFEFMMRLRRELGEIGEFRMFHQKMVLMTGPEASEAFFRAPDQQLDQSAAYKLMTPIFGEGVIFDAPLEKKEQQLKMLMLVLRDKPMRTYSRFIVEEVKKMIEDWSDSGEIDLVKAMKQLTIYTSSHCLLGNEFRFQLNEEFAAIYHDLEQGVNPLAYVFPHLPLPVFRQRDRARVRLQELITRIIDERATKMEKSEDAFQSLIDANYEDGSRLSAHEITGMLIGTIFAGHHTSAGTAAWVLIELCRRPEHMKRIVDDLDQILGQDDEVTFQLLRNMPQLENVIKEVLRIHPPLILLIRKVMQDLQYKDYTIEAGKFVCVSPPVSHRIAEIFPDPEKFDPDRYTPEREEDNIPFSWLGFGGGRHKCTGFTFAMLQLKTIFSVLLQRFEFELVDSPESYVDDYKQMVVQPSEPCRVRYRKRSAQKFKSLAPNIVSLEKEDLRCPFFQVIIDDDLCQGHAACMGEAPEVFRVDDSGKLVLLQQHPSRDLLGKVRQAEKYCPNKAIRIES